ncbi:MAG: hypothetical protein QHH10_12085 [Peptococcaceae bacterium]|nr:hypothetical protein [Peptococcaceae bacterium]MDH7526043.1 hypothetical protein [Peptococcaceae bacterium]
MINGKKYSWEDITATMPHGVLIDITDIEYSDGKEIEAQYGKGSMPTGYGVGNYSAEGKVSMLREEFNKLLAYAKSQGCTLYTLPPFPITVSYANEDQPMVTDTLKNVKFTKTSVSSSQGDKSVKVDLDIQIVGGIAWNGIQPA